MASCPAFWGPPVGKMGLQATWPPTFHTGPARPPQRRPNGYSGAVPYSDLGANKGLVGEAGFEPATPWPPARCAAGLRYSPNQGTILASSGAARSPCTFRRRLATAP